jgi:hypothetical protein
MRNPIKRSTIEFPSCHAHLQALTEGIGVLNITHDENIEVSLDWHF